MSIFYFCTLYVTVPTSFLLANIINAVWLRGARRAWSSSRREPDGSEEVFLCLPYLYKCIRILFLLLSMVRNKRRGEEGTAQRAERRSGESWPRERPRGRASH